MKRRKIFITIIVIILAPCLYFIFEMVRTSVIYNNMLKKEIAINEGFYAKQLQGFGVEGVVFDKSFLVESFDSLITFSAKGSQGFLWIISDFNVTNRTEIRVNTISDRLELEDGTYKDYIVENETNCRISYTVRTMEKSNEMELRLSHGARFFQPSISNLEFEKLIRIQSCRIIEMNNSRGELVNRLEFSPDAEVQITQIGSSLYLVMVAKN